jgi:DNA invertase Pin-like site-specific DNA recombinase
MSEEVTSLDLIVISEELDKQKYVKIKITNMKYVMYSRKSSEGEDRQMLSLDAQERELLEIAKKYNLEIVATYRESMSAKAIGRPVFNSMVEFIKSGKADAVLCWKLDRLARNFIDGGLVIDMLQKSVIQQIRTYEAVHHPNDPVYTLAFLFGEANQYSRNLSTNVKMGNREKLIQGGWPHRAGFGYLNDKADKTLIVNKKQAPYVVRAFELYVKERQTLKQVTNTLHEEGLRTGTGNKLGKSQVHRILNNRLYTGHTVDGLGIIRKGNHQSLVSVVLFNEAQELLHRKAHIRPKRHLYSAQGFLKCNVCGCNITVDTQKEIQYYYCTNGKAVCNQHKNYMRSDYVDVLMSDLFKELQFDDELIEMSAETYKVRNATDDNYVEVTLETLNSELNLLLDKELKLSDGWSSKAVRDEVYNIQIKEITNKRLELEEQIQNNELPRSKLTRYPLSV